MNVNLMQNNKTLAKLGIKTQEKTLLRALSYIYKRTLCLCIHLLHWFPHSTTGLFPGDAERAGGGISKAVLFFLQHCSIYLSKEQDREQETTNIWIFKKKRQFQVINFH